MTPEQIVDIAKRGGSIRWLDGTVETLAIGQQSVVISTNVKNKKSRRMALHVVYHASEQVPLTIARVVEPANPTEEPRDP
jgi:hypothetical protein